MLSFRIFISGIAESVENQLAYSILIFNLAIYVNAVHYAVLLHTYSLWYT